MLGIWAQFFGATIIVVIAGFYLARHADEIARLTGFGRVWIGLILLATATSLPELVAGVGSILVANSPDLAAGDAFGSNVFNLLLISLIILRPKWGRLLARRSRMVGRLASDGVFLIFLAVVALLISREEIGLPKPVTLIFPFVLLAVYMNTIYRSFHESESVTDVDLTAKPYVEIGHEEKLPSARRSWSIYLVSASVVVAASLWLVQSADRVAIELGWSYTFMGSAVMAASTSLPELAVAVAALQMRAPRLALANLFGSNMFNMGGVLFADSVATWPDAFFSAVSTEHITSAVAAIAMTFMLLNGPLKLGQRSTSKIDQVGIVRALVFVSVLIVANVTVFAAT